MMVIQTTRPTPYSNIFIILIITGIYKMTYKSMAYLGLRLRHNSMGRKGIILQINCLVPNNNYNFCIFSNMFM